MTFVITHSLKGLFATHSIRDTQHNDIRHNGLNFDTRHNGTQHNNTLSSAIMLSRYAECCVSFFVMLSVVTLNVVTLSVILLGVVAPIFFALKMDKQLLELHPRKNKEMT
jgi:hypothetical protein